MLRSFLKTTTPSFRCLSHLSSQSSSFHTTSATSANQPRPLNRALRGLYGGKRVIFGNNVSFSKRRTKRRWNPNVQTKRYTSDLLQEEFKIKITTAVMRTIKKFGSLDEYLLNTNEKKLYDSQFGRRLKIRVTKAKALQGGTILANVAEAAGTVDQTAPAL